MSTHPHEPAEADVRLEKVLADYMRVVEEGHPPAREDLLTRHPDLAEELQAFFRNRDFMEQHANRWNVDAPARIGDYELLEVIGSGTFGVVFKARHVKLDSLFAIKLLRGEQWSSPEHVQRFWAEAQRMAKLDHAHIVPVYGVGEYEDRHYFVMKFIEGGSLAERLHSCTPEDRASRRHQRWATELMVKVARAVHDAHQRAILHRDLKPGNILLDPNGNPHVADFGLAKQLPEPESLFEFGPADDHAVGCEVGSVADTVKTERGVIVGTATYMSAEAAAGGELTTASDIYSLGVVLYEMLTGQVPIRGDTPTETLQLIQKETPPAPRSLNPRIDHRLERACMKCLQRNPQARYGSALGLANDLERWLKDEPLVGAPGSFVERGWLWSKRYPALAGWLVTAAMLLVYVLFMALAVARTRAARLEEEVLKSNAFAAHGVASTVLWQLERWSEPVVEMANDTELRDALLHPGIQAVRKEHPVEERKRRLNESGEGLQAYFKRAIARYRDPATGFVGPEEPFPFETIHLLNSDGISLENRRHNGGGGDVTGKDFHGRGYFIGAMRKVGLRGKDAVHISRVYESHIDSLNKFSISVPVAGSDGQLIGVVSATITTDSTLGLVRLHDERRTGVLVDRWDPNPSAGPVLVNPPIKYVLMVHPAYHRGDKPFDVASKQLHAIHQSLSSVELHLRYAGRDFDPGQAVEPDYRDPVGKQNPDYAGRWLAGFAPVGNTELAVIVQQRYDDAIPPDHGILWGAIAVLLAFLLIVPLGWLGFQRLTHPQE
jgi:serine/threonine-protein kinase